MRYHVFCLGLAASFALWAVGPAAATDLDAPKTRQKSAHSRHHGEGRLRLPGPVLAMQVTRGPTCGFALFPVHPNYAKASCHDYDGVLTAYDPRSPTGVGLYTFRAHHRLR